MRKFHFIAVVLLVTDVVVGSTPRDRCDIFLGTLPKDIDSTSPELSEHQSNVIKHVSAMEALFSKEAMPVMDECESNWCELGVSLVKAYWKTSNTREMDHQWKIYHLIEAVYNYFHKLKGEPQFVLPEGDDPAPQDHITSDLLEGECPLVEGLLRGLVKSEGGVLMPGRGSLRMSLKPDDKISV
jgi:hypothetical protein